jgi:preprotein translocase subunit SecG
MVTIVIVSVVMVVLLLLFTYRGVALSASIRNEGILPKCHRASFLFR